MPFFKTVKKSTVDPKGKPSSSTAKKSSGGPATRSKPAPKKPTRAVGHRTRTVKHTTGKYNPAEDEITSSEEGGSDDDFLDLDGVGNNKRKAESDLSSDEDAHETEQEKRLRLAKDYLGELERRHVKKQADDDENADDDVDRVALTKQLKEDSARQLGKLHRPIAAGVTINSSAIRTMKTHYHTLNSVSVTHDGKWAIAGHRDGTIVKCDLTTSKVVVRHPGMTSKAWSKLDKAARQQRHVGAVNAVAMSHENQPSVFVTGGEDASVRVWDLDTMKCVKTFNGHRKAITSVTLRRGADRQIFSGSADNTVKAWDMAQMGYIDTMYGHADIVTAVHVLTRERSVSVGSTDRTLRVWKVADESQLVFNAYQSAGSMECVQMINDEHYVTGHTDGGLSVWSAAKKKPVATVHNAHTDTIDAPGSCQWITALATYPYTDLIASGSADGYVRLWMLAPDYKSLTPVVKVPVPGFINSLEFTADGTALVVGVGKEHRAGRWFNDEIGENVRNGITVIPLEYKETE